MISSPSITIELPEVGATGAVRMVAFTGRRLDEHLKGLYAESRRLKGEHLAACVALGHALSVVRARFQRGAWEVYVAGLQINLKSAQRAMDLNAKSGDGNGGVSPTRLRAIADLKQLESEQAPDRRHSRPRSGESSVGGMSEQDPDRRHVCRPSGVCSGDGVGGVGDSGGVTVREAERLTRGMRWDVLTETFVPAGANGQRAKEWGGPKGQSQDSGAVMASARGAAGVQGGLFDAVVARGVAALERARAVVASGGLDEGRRARIEDAVRVIEGELRA